MTKEEAERNNQGAKFWEYETPEILRTSRNAIRYYPQAGRLVVHLPDWENYKTGEKLPGKGVGINLLALSEEPDTLRRLISILQEQLAP